MKRLVLSLSALSLALSAFATDPVGKYNGKISVDLASIKKAVTAKAAKGTAEEKKQAASFVSLIDSQAKALNASTAKLEIKKGGTLSMSHTLGTKTESETGKWSVKGDTLTFTNLTAKNGGPTTITGTISKDGKTITFDLSKELQRQTAQFPGSAGTKGTLTFKRA